MSKPATPFRDVRTPQSRVGAVPGTVPTPPGGAPDPGRPSPDTPRPDAPRPDAPRLDPRAAAADLPPERGGYDGPEPTRFGDWEHKGRCTDF